MKPQDSVVKIPPQCGFLCQTQFLVDREQLTHTSAVHTTILVARCTVNTLSPWSPQTCANTQAFFISSIFPSRLSHHESATRDTCGPVRPALQKGMRLLREHSVARPVLQVLEGGVPACATEADPGWLGFGRKVGPFRIGADALTSDCPLSEDLNDWMCLSSMPGCSERRKQPTPLVMAPRPRPRSRPKLQHRKHSQRSHLWDPSPNLRRKKPTRRHAKSPRWRSSSAALHHAPRRKVGGGLCLGLQAGDGVKEAGVPFLFCSLFKRSLT